MDPTPGPPEAQDGVLRQVTPLINFPNYTTSVFPPYSSLSTDPAEHVNDTQLEDTKGAGWCSVDLAPRVRSFDFAFTETGWHMYVINTTWARPTIVGQKALRVRDFMRLMRTVFCTTCRMGPIHPKTAPFLTSVSTPFSQPKQSGSSPFQKANFLLLPHRLSRCCKIWIGGHPVNCLWNKRRALVRKFVELVGARPRELSSYIDMCYYRKR